MVIARTGGISMKRTVHFLLALFLVLGLMSCGQSAEPT